MMLEAPLMILQIVLIQIQTYIRQPLSQINNKRCLLNCLWDSIYDIKILYIHVDTAIK